MTTPSSCANASIDGPATYRIRVKGRIKASWSDRFEGMAISSTSAADGATVTTLLGSLTDQAALAGVINGLHTLRLPILSVECLASWPTGEAVDSENLVHPDPAGRRTSVTGQTTKETMAVRNPDDDHFGFDPAQYTPAPLQTEGWIRFTGSPEDVFAQIANHEAMTQWLPLLKEVTVTQPGALPPGENSVGTTRTLVFQGGLTLVERIVYWNAPLCYAYDTHGRMFPMDGYIGLMGVEPGTDGGGTFIFREYFGVAGRVGQAVIPHGLVPAMRAAFGKLSQLIGGTDYEVKHVEP